MATVKTMVRAETESKFNGSRIEVPSISTWVLLVLALVTLFVFYRQTGKSASLKFDTAWEEKEQDN